MYPVTDYEKDLYMHDYLQSIEITASGQSGRITITEADIMQGTLAVERASVNEDKIGFGVAEMSNIQFQLNNDSGKFNDFIFEGAELFVKFGVIKTDAMHWEKAQTHYMPAGYFIIDESPRRQTTIVIEGYDRMIRFERYYECKNNFPMTAYDFLQEVCTVCGVPLGTTERELTNADYIINYAPKGDDITYHEIIGWLGGLTGTCAYMDWEGKLRMEWYKPTDIKIGRDIRYASDMHEIPVTITGVYLEDIEKNSFLCGTDDYTLDVGDNPLIQHSGELLAQSLGNKAVGLTYLPHVCTTVPMPFMYPLDMIEIQDQNGVFQPSLITNVFAMMNANTEFKGSGLNITANFMSTAPAFTKEQKTIFDRLTNRVSGFEETVQLNDIITNSLGLYSTSIKQGDGSRKFYMHNKPTLEESDIIYTLVAGGFAYTKDGWNDGNPVWQYGFDKDGNAVLNALYAYKIKADVLEGGTITGVKIQGNEIVGGTITGTTISSDNVNITGGSVNVEGNKDEQIIKLSAFGTPGSGEQIVLSPDCASVEELVDGNRLLYTDITPSVVQCVENDYAVLSMGCTGIDYVSSADYKSGTVFNVIHDTNQITWGDDSYNFLHGYWYGQVSSSSDRNKKHSIEKLNEKYKALFNSLQPVRFVYNEQEDEKFTIGFIAQDVLAAIKKAGLEPEDFSAYIENDGIIALNYQQFISLNTMMLQETRKELADTKQELKKLKDEMEEMKKALADLS